MPELKTINAALAFLGKKLDAILEAVRSTPQKVSIDIAEQTKESLRKETMAGFSSMLDQLAEVAAKKDFRVDIDLSGQEKLLRDLIDKGKEQSSLLESILSKESVQDNAEIIKAIKDLQRALPETKKEPDDLRGVLGEIKEAIQKIKVKIPADITINDRQFKELSAGMRLGGVVNTTDGGEAYTTIRDGRQTVTSPGTAVALSTQQIRIRKVEVTGLLTNQDVVAVGASTVVAATSGFRGTPLMQGDTATFYVDDLRKIFINARAGGDGVSFTFFE